MSPAGIDHSCAAHARLFAVRRIPIAPIQAEKYIGNTGNRRGLLVT